MQIQKQDEMERYHVGFLCPSPEKGDGQRNYQLIDNQRNKKVAFLYCDKLFSVQYFVTANSTVKTFHIFK